MRVLLSIHPRFAIPSGNKSRVTKNCCSGGCIRISVSSSPSFVHLTGRCATPFLPPQALTPPTTMDISLNPFLDTRFQCLIWQLLDAEQYKSALFWSERYFSLDKDNHSARHLYSLSLLRCGQTQSALHHVNVNDEMVKRCHDCIDIYAKCCSVLGRYALAKDALESVARGEGMTGKGASPASQGYHFFL